MSKVELMVDFEKITDKLLSVDLSRGTEDIIHAVEQLLQQREAIIDMIDELEESEKIPDDLLSRILLKNQQVETRLSEIQLKIKKDIENVVKEKSLSSKKKKAHRGYMNYGRQNDGYFIDKKK